MSRPQSEPLDTGMAALRLTQMALIATKSKPKATPRPARRHRQLDGRQLALLLRKMDAAKSIVEKRRWHRAFMLCFYGDKRADAYA
jgi:hypothetical protein